MIVIQQQIKHFCFCLFEKMRRSQSRTSFIRWRLNENRPYISIEAKGSKHSQSGFKFNVAKTKGRFTFESWRYLNEKLLVSS